MNVYSDCDPVDKYAAMCQKYRDVTISSSISATSDWHIIKQTAILLFIQQVM